MIPTFFAHLGTHIGLSLERQSSRRWQSVCRWRASPPGGPIARALTLFGGAGASASSGG